jgi:hypothetical protein
MSDIKINNITSFGGSNGPVISGITTAEGSFFGLPRGDTAYRGGRGRGIFGGGYGQSQPHAMMNTIDYVTIATLGNALDFGDLSVRRNAYSGGSSATRGLFIAGRFSPSSTWYNTIDYITIQSTGNAFDFGDLIHNTNPLQKGTSNQIRSVYGGGYIVGTPNSWLSTIGYFTIATKGNSSDFGSFMYPGRKQNTGSNGTRGIFAGTRGANPGSPGVNTNHIEYVIIATLGNAEDFGDTTKISNNMSGGMTSSTRMVMQGGASGVNTLDYITMASLGDAIDFGDVSTTVREFSSSTSSPTRGVLNTGSTGAGTPTNNTIEYITISTLGNSQDFGDLTRLSGVGGSLSDAHGGLG